MSVLNGHVHTASIRAMAVTVVYQRICTSARHLVDGPHAKQSYSETKSSSRHTGHLHRHPLFTAPCAPSRTTAGISNSSLIQSSFGKRSLHQTTTSTNSGVVCNASDLSDQEREDYLYSAAFIPNMRKAYALPPEINLSTVDTVATEYAKLNVGHKAILDSFQDSVSFYMTQLSANQLVGASLTLSHLGVKAPELQRQLRETLRTTGNTSQKKNMNILLASEGGISGQSFVASFTLYKPLSVGS